jgi:hypothetical protein
LEARNPKDALLRQYQEEIEKLKAMLAGKIPVQGEPSTSGKYFVVITFILIFEYTSPERDSNSQR